MMASWAFWVNRSSCISGLSGRWRGLVHELEEALGRFAGGFGQVGRQNDLGPGVQVAVALGTEPWHALTGQPEHPAGLGSGRDRKGDAALGRADLDLRA